MRFTDSDDLSALDDVPWFIPRMMDDKWSFGLLLSTGQVLCVECINTITTSPELGTWLNVSLMESLPFHVIDDVIFITAPTSRTTMSVALKDIVGAFELADT